MKKYMSDYIIKCIGCNARSYEVESEEHEDYTYKLYKCSECNFEWEVISSAGKRSI
jgi:hypothetical protein